MPTNPFAQLQPVGGKPAPSPTGGGSPGFGQPDQFMALLGPNTSSQAVNARETGGQLFGIPAAQPAAPQASLTGSRQNPSTTPAQASQENATFPGIRNGQPNNGFPAEFPQTGPQTQGGTALDPRFGPGGIWGGGPQRPPAAQPPAAPAPPAPPAPPRKGGPRPQRPRVGPAGARPRQPMQPTPLPGGVNAIPPGIEAPQAFQQEARLPDGTPVAAASAAGDRIPAVAQAPAAPAATVAAGDTAPQEAGQSAPAPGATATEPTGYVNLDSAAQNGQSLRYASPDEDPRNFNRQYGQPKPSGWNRMSDAERMAWQQENYQPFIEGVSGQWEGYGDTGNDSFQGTQAEYIANSPNDDIAERYIEFMGLPAGTLSKANNFPDIPTAPIVGDDRTRVPGDMDLEGRAGLVDDPALQGVMTALEVAQSDLAKVAADPGAYTQSQIRTFQKRYDTSRALLERYGIDYDPADETTYSNYNADEGIVGEGGVEDITLDQVGGDPGPLPRWVIDSLQAGENSTDRAALLEFMTQRNLLQSAQDDRQIAVDLGTENLRNVVNDPMNARLTGAVNEMFDNPNPVDYDLLRNRTTDRFNQLLTSGTSSLGQLAGRSGRSAASMAGLQGELAQTNRADLARSLGEYDIQEQMGDRAGLLQAITAGSQVQRQVQGSESLARQLLMQAVTGQAVSAQNPFSGITDTALGLDSYRRQIEAMEDAERGAEWGGLAGGVLGGGLGAIFGGAAGAQAGYGIGSGLGNQIDANRR